MRPATKLTAFKYRDGGRDTPWIHSVITLSHGRENVIRGKRLAIVHAFFFPTTPFYIYDHFDMRNKILCNTLACCKVKNAPPALPAAPFWKMDDSLELTWHFFCPHKFGHGRTIGTICQLARSRQSVSQSCLPPKKKNKHLEAWGSECKCEYIHPHAALLNLWA